MKLAPIVFILVAFSTACSRAPHSNAAIKDAVVEHLNKGSGLNLAQVDIDVTNVAYQGDKNAIATVFFRPKSNPDQGMTMNYALEAQGTKWVVTKKPGMAGNGGNPHGGAPTAPGAEGGMGSPAGQLPPGHPPVSEGKGAAETAPANPAPGATK